MTLQPKEQVFFSIAVCILQILFAGKMLSAGAPSDSVSEKASYLLTVQDKLLEGIPEDRGDSWLLNVHGKNGGFLISKFDVLFIGPTRESVFQFKKEHIPAGNIERITKLAEWGSRNQLTDSALSLLKETAASADPDTAAVLKRQIDQIEYVERLKKEANLKLSRYAESKKAADEKDPELKRLEDFGRQVPLSVQDSFARKIQPILLRRCAAADCHQQGTPGMALTFIQSDHRSSLRKNNLANLEQVLRRVDLISPAASPILNHPEIADLSGVQVFPFGSDMGSLKDFDVFSNWILSLNGKFGSLVFTDPIIPQPDGNESAQLDLDDGKTGEKEESVSVSLPSQPIDITESQNPGIPPVKPKYRKITKIDLASPEPASPVSHISDEFDPDPFNQKYHPGIFQRSEEKEEEE